MQLRVIYCLYYNAYISNILMCAVSPDVCAVSSDVCAVSPDVRTASPDVCAVV